jgi:hypothetical protein
MDTTVLGGAWVELNNQGWLVGLHGYRGSIGSDTDLDETRGTN